MACHPGHHPTNARTGCKQGPALDLTEGRTEFCHRKTRYRTTSRRLCGSASLLQAIGQAEGFIGTGRHRPCQRQAH
jgi:hypothetical protein